MVFVFLFILKALFLIIAVLISVAYFTLVERKFLGITQRRQGPNVIGFLGLLQPLADGIKLLFKEFLLPSSSDKIMFIISPVLTFAVSLFAWVFISFSSNSFLVELELSSLYVLAFSSLGIYGILISGWSSNSKYAFLGSIRSAAQMVSYELPLGFIVSIIALCSSSFNLNIIIYTQIKSCWFAFSFPLLFLVAIICFVAETNRHPFDLPEAEAELVSGYNVEYSAMAFALFSLGEYSNILLASSFLITLFLGGWDSLLTNIIYIPSVFWFSLKILFFVILFVFLRAGLPRYRYDQLMDLGWKVFLPLVLFQFFIILIFLNF